MSKCFEPSCPPYHIGTAMDKCEKCVLKDGVPTNIIIGIQSNGGTAWVKNADTNEFIPKECATFPPCPDEPVTLDPASIEALCDCINTSLEMTLNVELTPENKDLLAACIATALEAANLTVTIDNLEELAAALCDALAPKLQAIVDAIGEQTTTLGDAIADLATTLCEKLENPKEIKCIKQRFIETGLDNTRTKLDDTNTVLCVMLTDGTYKEVPAGGPYANFTLQMQAWETVIEGCLPDAQQIDLFAVGGLFGLPAPVVPLPKMKFRYLGIRTCPDDVTLQWVSYKSDQTNIKRLPVVSVPAPETTHNYCIDCEGNVEWIGTPPVLGEDGQPICAIPCAQAWPEVPEPECKILSDIQACDDVNSENEEDWVPFTYLVQDCGNGLEYTPVQINTETGAVTDYPIVGTPLDAFTKQQLFADEWWEQFKTTCPSGGVEGADYTSAMPTTGGRPLPTVPWALIDNRDPNNQITVASGATFAEFVTDLAAKGYTDFIEGEIHHICPCPPGAEVQGDWFTTADGDTAAKGGCVPLAELRNAPTKEQIEEKCALRTIGCLDQQFLDELKCIKAALTEECPECPELDVGQATLSDDGSVISFPHSTDNPDIAFADFSVPMTVSDPSGCLADNPDALISIQVNARHATQATGNVGHFGFLWIISDGAGNQIGQFVDQSASNTFGSNSNIGGIGQSVIAMGHQGEAGNIDNDRWVKFEVTAAQLLAGISLVTGGFGAVNNSFDVLFNLDIELCGGTEEICDGC